MKTIVLVVLAACGVPSGSEQVGVPDAGVDRPDSGTPGADGGAPDSGVYRTDAAVNEHDAAVDPPEPDAASVALDAGPVACLDRGDCLGGRDCCAGECVDLSLASPNCGACGVDCMDDPTTDSCVSGACRCGRDAPCVSSTSECCAGACVPRGTCGREPLDCPDVVDDGLLREQVACIDPLGVDWWCVEWGLCPRACGICPPDQQCCETVVGNGRGQACGPLGGPGACS